MALMFVCAALGVAASIFIPLITMAIVNGPIASGDREQLVWMSLLALLVGTAEAALIFARRRIQSVAVLQVEAQIRDDLYVHLQRLSVAFHDRWQTGQLLSRATTDLGTIRRFLGFGAIFLVVNTLQCTAVIVLLLILYWQWRPLLDPVWTVRDPIAAAALQVFLMTAASGMGKDDDISVARLYAQIAGIDQTSISSRSE
jgi:ABC-type multidrug transport system fused ATPase/permease subunit